MHTSKAEEERINILIRRDGLEATREWVKRTLNIYRAAIVSPASHASQKEYKPLFEKSIQEFRSWLAAHPEKNSARQNGDRADKVTGQNSF